MSTNRLNPKDGVVVERDSACEIWLLNNQFHRDDGPAITWFELNLFNTGLSMFEYYQHGELHREDGPAVITYDNKPKWYLHGKYLTFDQFCTTLNKTEHEKLLLAIKYGVGQ